MMTTQYSRIKKHEENIKKLLKEAAEKAAKEDLIGTKARLKVAYGYAKILSKYMPCEKLCDILDQLWKEAHAYKYCKKAEGYTKNALGAIKEGNETQLKASQKLLKNLEKNIPKGEKYAGATKYIRGTITAIHEIEGKALSKGINELSEKLSSYGKTLLSRIEKDLSGYKTF